MLVWGCVLLNGRFGAPAAAQKNDMFCGVGFLVFGIGILFWVVLDMMCHYWLLRAGPQLGMTRPDG